MGIALVVALVSGTSLVAIAGWQLSSKVQENSVDISKPGDDAPPPNIGAFDGGFNLLVVGIDNDPNQSTETGYGERDATLNDVNILLHVSNDHKTAVAVSFPRDLIISHPECEGPDGTTYAAMSAQPINEAYERGGLACVVRTVESVSGLDIGNAAVVSFDAVVKITDAIGGVPICLTAPMTDKYITYKDESGSLQELNLPAGITSISGGEALGFLRSRHGVGDGSDLGRISSQQQYMSSLVRKLKADSTLTDLGKLYSIARVVADPENVKLSQSMTSLDRMISMAQALRTVDLKNMVFVQYPGSTDDPNFPQKVVPNKAAADQLFALISADQPFQLGAESQGVGTTAQPVDPNAPTPVATTDPNNAAPSDPGAPATDPNAAPEATLDNVTGQTAGQETCAIPNSDAD